MGGAVARRVINIKPIYNYNLPYDINTLIKVKKRGGVYIFNLNNELIKVFKGELLAGKYFNIPRHRIQSYIKNNIIIDNKYIIKNYDYFIKSSRPPLKGGAGARRVNIIKLINF